jgi:hypothetical protein
MKMNSYSSLFFLAMLFQGAKAPDPDIICDRLEAIANSFAVVIQDVLNNQLGGVVPIESLLSYAYDSYEIAFKQPSFIGCEMTLSQDIKVNGVVPFPDQEGTATVKGTFDYTALLERQVCVTGLEVTELEIDNFPPALQDFVEAVILGSFDVPDICVPLPGLG